MEKFSNNRLFLEDAAFAVIRAELLRQSEGHVPAGTRVYRPGVRKAGVRQHAARLLTRLAQWLDPAIAGVRSHVDGVTCQTWQCDGAKS